MIDTQPIYIAPIDVLPADGKEAERYALLMQRLPERLLKFTGSDELADFIDELGVQFSLSPEQRKGIARFILDIVLSVEQPADMATALSHSAGIGHTEALQVIKEVENHVLAKLGMSLADVGRSYNAPELVELAGGQEAMRYASLSDLLADIESLSSPERIAFLKDAKKDNRVLVLKAFSQLKLGTDRKGNPLTFTELVKRETPDFLAQDWIDLAFEDIQGIHEESIWDGLKEFLTTESNILTIFSHVTTAESARLFHEALSESLPRAKPTIIDYIRWSPYFAGVYDKDTGINGPFFDNFASLPTIVRQRMVSADLAGRIQALIRDGSIPENYGVAVAKLIFLVAIGQVDLKTVPNLLSEKLGLGSERGAMVSKRIISELMTGLLISDEDRRQTEPPIPEPPETQEEKPQRRSAKKPANGTIGNMRNVVDLRNTQEG